MPTAVGALMGSPSPGTAVTAAKRNAKSTVVTKKWGVADAEYDLRLSDPAGTQSYGARTRTSRRPTDTSCHKFVRQVRRSQDGNRRWARRAAVRRRNGTRRGPKGNRQAPERQPFP